MFRIQNTEYRIQNLKRTKFIRSKNIFRSVNKKCIYFVLNGQGVHVSNGSE